MVELSEKQITKIRDQRIKERALQYEACRTIKDDRELYNRLNQKFESVGLYAWNWSPYKVYENLRKKLYLNDWK